MEYETRQLVYAGNKLSDEIKETIRIAAKEYDEHGPLFMEYFF